MPPDERAFLTARNFANILGQWSFVGIVAIGMTFGTGVKTALDASVFSAAAGAFGLALLGPDPWSVDGLRAGPRRAADV